MQDPGAILPGHKRLYANRGLRLSGRDLQLDVPLQRRLTRRVGIDKGIGSKPRLQQQTALGNCRARVEVRAAHIGDPLIPRDSHKHGPIHFE
jgi:hypothetical protein